MSFRHSCDLVATSMGKAKKKRRKVRIEMRLQLRNWMEFLRQRGGLVVVVAQKGKVVVVDLWERLSLLVEVR